MKVENLKKVSTGSIAVTPLEAMPRLTQALGCQPLYVKRDDLTGLAFGGNKTRKLDYIVQYALENGYDTLLTYGGTQTNHGRLTAAAAAKFGMRSILMCYGKKSDYASGNLILDRMLGADIVFMDTEPIRSGVFSRDEIITMYGQLKKRSTDFIVDKYERDGHKVYIMPIGGHTEIGALGYFDAVPEILVQMQAQGVTAKHVVVGYGSTGTFAGLWLGAKYYNAPFEVIGATVAPGHTPPEETASFINKISRDYELGITCRPEELNIDVSAIGTAYNEPDAQTREAMYLLARTEAIFTDPCYTGKTFKSFLNLIENGTIAREAPAVYWHTGGTPAIWTREHLDAMQTELWGDEGIYQMK